MPANRLYLILLLACITCTAFAQKEAKGNSLHFILVDDKSFPDVVTVNNNDEQGICDNLNAWISKHAEQYFKLLSEGKTYNVTRESIDLLPAQNQKEFLLALGKLAPSIQCQRFTWNFPKSEQMDLHQDKVVNQYYYLVSKNDFEDLKSKSGNSKD